MPAGIEMVAATELDATQQKKFSFELAQHMTLSAAPQMLKNRYMPGVVARHETAEASEDTLKRSAERMQAGLLGAFVLLDSQSNHVLGMSSYQPNLQLFRQRYNLAPRVTRNFVLSKRIKTAGTANVAAWGIFTDTSLAEAYRATTAAALEAPDIMDTWAREPIDSPKGIHEAIKNAGYFWDDEGFFDDMETSRELPPLSSLYWHTHEDPSAHN